MNIERLNEVKPGHWETLSDMEPWRIELVDGKYHVYEWPMYGTNECFDSEHNTLEEAFTHAVTNLV